MVHTKSVYYYGNDQEIFHGNVGVLKCFEMMIADYISYSEKLTHQEMKKFMVIALKMSEIRINKENGNPYESKFIIANILFICKFEPFLKQFDAFEWERLPYYIVLEENGDIEKYARQFLNN